jgi:hypothetical protein
MVRYATGTLDKVGYAMRRYELRAELAGLNVRVGLAQRRVGVALAAGDLEGASRAADEVARLGQAEAALLSELACIRG